jgi:hypothetical protein
MLDRIEKLETDHVVAWESQEFFHNFTGFKSFITPQGRQARLSQFLQPQTFRANVILFLLFPAFLRANASKRYLCKLRGDYHILARCDLVVLTDFRIYTRGQGSIVDVIVIANVEKCWSTINMLARMEEREVAKV